MVLNVQRVTETVRLIMDGEKGGGRGYGGGGEGDYIYI